MTTIALPARAKLNLDLKVTGTRSDGRHELRTRMQAVDLHDLLEVEAAERTELKITGLGIAGGHRNTVLAAHAAFEEAARRPCPVHFRLHKRIPAGSGLGGASSDAAAALRALAAMSGIAVDLRPLARKVGADVTFFLTGGAALVEGVGERVARQLTEDCWFAIAWPGIELSTAEVYRAWDEVGGEGGNELRRAAAHVEPKIDTFARTLGGGWRMTGSGSAFFSRHADRASAEAAAGRLECWTAVTRPVEAWA